MNESLAVLFLFLIIASVFNVFAILGNDCREWFRDMLEYNIGVLILVFTLFLPATIIMGLIYILSIRPFGGKEK